MKVTVLWRRSELGPDPQASEMFTDYTDVNLVFFENGFLHITKSDGSSRHISADVIEAWEEEPPN